MPLTVRQIHSMQAMQRHAPEMKAIQKKYKGDRKKQQEELAAFYKENKINPAASCLPLVAQFPVFISLYLVLKHFTSRICPGLGSARTHASRQGGQLGWLHIVPNITAKASAHWSGYLLLAIYAASQVLSTYFMSATMDKTQRRIMMVVPLIFISVIAQFPGRPRHLLGDDEPVDRRPGNRHPPARPESGRDRAAAVPKKPRGRRRRRERRQGGSRPPPKPAPAARAVAPQPRRVKRKKGSPRR